MIPRRAWPVIKLALLGAFILFTILPLVQMTVLSFTATLAQDGLSLGETTLRNYRAIWADPSLRAAFGNSVAYVLINIAITIPVALPAAFAFARLSFLGDKHRSSASSPFASPRPWC